MPPQALQLATVAPEQLAELQPRAEEAASLLRLLGNPHRLLILCALVEGELSVGQLQARLPQLHPYELPELLAVESVFGLPAYLQWVVESTRPVE